MKKALASLLFILFSAMPLTIFAQSRDVIPPLMPTEPAQSPIGGLALLAAGGGAYAIKKLREQKKG
ncbi:MAG TPA: hypothetical protein VK106_05735 [Balneolaceae bacterium]|nr:hypothetical protein [Balneolaceae bacterium]